MTPRNLIVPVSALDHSTAACTGEFSALVARCPEGAFGRMRRDSIFSAKVKVLFQEPTKVAQNLGLCYLPQKRLAGDPALLGVPEFLLGDSHEQPAVVLGPGLIRLGCRSLLLRCLDEAFEDCVNQRTSVQGRDGRYLLRLLRGGDAEDV